MQPTVANDAAESGGWAGRCVVEDDARGHFEVEDAESPILDHVNDVAL